MSAPQPGLTPDFAVAQRELMLQGLEENRKQRRRSSRPCPIRTVTSASTPNHALLGNLPGTSAPATCRCLTKSPIHKFDMAHRFKQEPRDIADLVNCYETNFLGAANRIRAMTPAQLATSVDFDGACKMPAVFYLGFVNNHSATIAGNSPPTCGPWAQRFLRSTAAAPTNPGTAKVPQSVSALKRRSPGSNFLEPCL